MGIVRTQLSGVERLERDGDVLHVLDALLGDAQVQLGELLRGVAVAEREAGGEGRHLSEDEAVERADWGRRGEPPSELLAVEQSEPEGEEAGVCRGTGGEFLGESSLRLGGRV